MPMMLATKRHTYGNKKIAVGDVYNVSVHDVRLLKALGWVTDMTAVKAMTSETTPELAPPPLRHAVQESKPIPQVIEETQPVAEETKAELPPLPPSPPSSPLPPTNILDALNEVVEEEKKEESMSSSSPAPNTEYSTMLRIRARNLGLRVDGRWSDERVQREIDEHNKKTYQRMDVRASE
jgi:outer membrane biosynthesis protein TonB